MYRNNYIRKNALRQERTQDILLRDDHLRPCECEMSSGHFTPLEGEAGENADFGISGVTTLSASLRSAPPPDGDWCRRGDDPLRLAALGTSPRGGG